MHKNNTLLIILAIIIIGFTLYSNSVFNQFTYDDFEVIVKNQYISQLSNLRHIFSKQYFFISAERTYRPTVTISYFLDHAFWGMKSWGYHLTNICLHILASLIIYLLCRRIFQSGPLSLLAVLIFVSHPIQTETVNAIAFREEILFTIFFIMAILLYDKFHQQNNNRAIYLIASVIFFILSLFSKEHAIVFPLIIILYDYYFIAQFNTPKLIRNARYILIYAFLSAGFFIFAKTFYPAHFIRTAEFASNFLPLSTFTSEACTRIYVIGYYIKLLFFPLTLCADYFIKAVISFWEWRVLISIFGIAITITIALLCKRRFRYVSFGIFWFYISLIPVANIFPIGNVMAERFLYLPSIGFCIALSWLLMRSYTYVQQNKNTKLLKPIFLFVIFAIFIFCDVVTFNRNMIWKDDFTLWRDTVITSPLSPRAHNSLGVAYFTLKDYKHAEEEYKEALRLYPFYGRAYNNLGSLYVKIQAPKQAVEQLSKAVAILPNNARVHRNLAVALIRDKQYKQALLELKEAVALKPDFVTAHYELAVVYVRLGYIEEAIQHYKKVLEFNPDYTGVRFDLGLLYYKTGRIKQAQDQWQEALEIDPTFKKAKIYLEKVKNYID